MSSFVTPMIYDRTATDVATRTSKAFFNVADWARIYGNTEVINAIANIMLGLEIPFTELTPPTVLSFPTASEINQLVENIELVRAGTMFPVSAVVALEHNYQSGSGANVPDYLDVNAWEQDIDLICAFLKSLGEWTISCGVAACGQPRLWQVRFRKWVYVPDAASPVRRPRCGVAVSGVGMSRQNSWRKYS